MCPWGKMEMSRNHWRMLVDDDEGEDVVATEMRGPDEPTNAMRKASPINARSISRTMRERTCSRQPTSKVGRGSARRDSHSNRLLLHENEATR